MDYEKIDRLIATHIMEMEWDDEECVYYKKYDVGRVFMCEYFKPTRNIRDAWEVVSKMKGKGFYFVLDTDYDHEYEAYFRDGFYEEDVMVSSYEGHKSASVAICLAVLKVLKIDIN